MTTYTIDCTPPDGKRRTLRVRGASEAQAIMGAYDYLARQWDGAGDVHEGTLTPIAGEPTIIEGRRHDPPVPRPPSPRPYSVKLRRSTEGGGEARKAVQVHARSPQGARAMARSLHPGWSPYAPRAI